MIKSFRHKGLKKFYDTASVAGIHSQHSKRLRMQLLALDTATNINDMDIPGFNLHPLKGSDKDRDGQFGLMETGELLLNSTKAMPSYLIMRITTNGYV